MKLVTIVGTNFKIVFDYSPLVVNQVRCLPQGRRWDPVTHAWWCPASVDALAQLREFGFEIGPDVIKWEQEFYKPSKPDVVAVDDIPGLKGKLYPFQAEGVGFLESRGGRALLGHEMGLGKTIMAIAWLQHNPKALPAVVICPASLKGLWETECARWTTINSEILSGSKPWVPHAAEDRNWISIINYDVLGPWIETLSRCCHTVVLDECHYLKSSKTIRTKAVKLFCKGKPHVLALSGTPIVNRPSEFFNSLNILAPTTFPKWWDFALRYCAARHNGFGWDTSGASNTEELHTRAETVMLRRLKKDVLKDLPEKQRTVVPLSLSVAEQATYDVALREALGAWNEDEKPSPLKDITQISKLRQAVIEAKFDACKEWIDNFLETDRKLVVFVVHHKTSDKLRELYGDKMAVYMDGRTDTRLRAKVVEKFQTDPTIKLFIGSVDVAGMGITLTAAQDAVFLELPWVPGLLAQCEDRIHRIGQKGSVNEYYLLALDTMEKDMWELLNEKTKVLDAVLDGKTPENDGSIFREIKRRITNKKQRRTDNGHNN